MPATVTIRPGSPDFLDLPWERSLPEWDDPRLIDLPKGISRHPVRFLAVGPEVYAVKELAERAARRDFDVLRQLEAKGSPAVRPIGLVEHRYPDPTAEQSAALITEYARYSFSYRELLEGAGFGARRNQMLDAFAGLLVELHLAGCFWGDCSLSNVLYRFDAEGIETLMVDAETAELHEILSDGQREEDVAIMIENVAGGMADIAAQHGLPMEEADFELGEDIAGRYRSLWSELGRVDLIGPDERYLIDERIARLNALGFDVDEIDLIPDGDHQRLRMKVRVGGRNFHTDKLRSLTGVEALENQARQILSDLYYHQANDAELSSTGKGVAAVRWRVGVFEPMLRRLTNVPEVVDPVQAYCDLLHHRYVRSVEEGFDIGTERAYEDWLERGRPGYPLGV